MKNKSRVLILTLLSLSVLTFLNVKQDTNVINNVKNATNVDSYYSSVDDTSASSLFNSLSTIINNGADIGTYSDLWDSYKTTDVDENGYIVDMYSNTTHYTPGTDQDKGSHSVEGDTYNREHTIPKSWWGGSESNQGADLFIVYPTDSVVNQSRSNYPYGEVENSTYESNNGYSKLGSSYYSSGPSTVFEPADEWKGDLARVYFYAVTKWVNRGNWPFTQADGSYIFTTSQNGFYLTDYSINLFVKWHLQDPVSDWELNRNDNVYEIQNNRNPYIDHPEYVTQIWGESDWYDGPIGGEDIVPTDIQINPPSLNLEVGDTYSLSITTTPSNASKSVSWSSSNPNVVSVNNNGDINALSEGNATISVVSTLDSSVTDSVNIVVNPKTSVSITSDTLECSDFKNQITGSGYEEWEYTTTESKVTFKGISYTGNNDIQIKSSDNSGIIITSNSNLIESVDVSWKESGDTIQIYGSNTAYTSPSNLYSASTTGTLLGELSSTNETHLDIEGDYKYLGFKSKSGTINLNSITINYKSTPLEITSINASISKDFYVGDVISKDDITVKDNLGNIITDFVLENDQYQFKYEDTQGGDVVSYKQFDITYDEFTTSIDVPVSRKAYVQPQNEEIDITFTNTNISISSSNRTTGNVTIGGGTYYVQNAYIYSNQYLSFGKDEGYIQNVNPYEGDIVSFEVSLRTSSTRTDYTNYVSKDGIVWVECTQSTLAQGGYKYFKHAYTSSSSSYSNVISINITIEGKDNALNISNYIMYEDTTNQCLTKLDVALDYLNNLSNDEKNIFMTSNDYVIKTARERLNAWCINQGKTIEYLNGELVIKNSNDINLFDNSINYLLIIIAISSITLLSILVIIKKRKVN